MATYSVPPTVTLFGIDVLDANLDDTASECMRLVNEGRSVQHVCLNASKTVMMHDDPGLATIVRSCDIVSADGVSIVLASRILGAPLRARVPGIDLMEVLLSRAEQEGYPVYFLGATEAVVERFIAGCMDRYPALKVAGSHSGYFEDRAIALQEVRDSGARMLFVGMPSPQKEYLLADHAAELPGVFAMGVGGSFDVGAGLTRRAPLWAQSMGLEWAYRMVQEPRRMLKRYVVGNTRFLGLLGREYFGGRR